MMNEYKINKQKEIELKQDEYNKLTDLDTHSTKMRVLSELLNLQKELNAYNQCERDYFKNIVFGITYHIICNKEIIEVKPIGITPQGDFILIEFAGDKINDYYYRKRDLIFNSKYEADEYINKL